MKIIGAHWTPEVNWLELECSCGSFFDHRADRWTVRCPGCGASAHLGVLRDEYATHDPAVRARMIKLRHPEPDQ